MRYKRDFRSTFHQNNIRHISLKLKNNKKLSKNNKYILTINNESCKVEKRKNNNRRFRKVMGGYIAYERK